METTILESIGLTKNESITYLTLLKIGTSKTGNILKISRLNSGKIYEILDSLKRKGLVSETIKDNIKFFTAAPPAQLSHYLELKKQAIYDEEKTIQKLLPSLEALRNQIIPEKRIVTYSGFRGIITAAEEALRNTPEGSEILSLGISDINAWSQNYWLKWEKMRENKKIRARYILSQKGTIYNDMQTPKNIKTRILKLDTPVGIDIYGKNIVLILHYQEPISCTMIYDEHTNKTFRSYFEPLWAIAKEK
ncbi:MAG: TrmB family transcriptional regulator [Candidatus Nanoarchaeia archaeon]